MVKSLLCTQKLRIRFPYSPPDRTLITYGLRVFNSSFKLEYLCPNGGMADTLDLGSSALRESSSLSSDTMLI